MTEPKYKPGEFVILRGQVELNNVLMRTELIQANDLAKLFAEMSAGKTFGVFHVLETLIQTCPGGTQVKYLCRGHTSGSCTVDLMEFNEIELAPYVPSQSSA